MLKNVWSKNKKKMEVCSCCGDKKHQLLKDQQIGFTPLSQEVLTYLEFEEFVYQLFLRIHCRGCSDECMIKNLVEPFQEHYDIRYDGWIENHILHWSFYRFREFRKFTPNEIERIRFLINDPKNFLNNSPLMQPLFLEITD